MIPGFIAVKLFVFFSYYEKTITSFNIAYYSLTVGTISYFSTRFILDLQPQDEITMFVFTVIFVAIVASITGWIKRKLVSKRMVRNSTWDNFVMREVGTYIRVKTTDGKVVYGWLKSASTDVYKNHDIVINEPYIFQEGKEKKIGKSMFINSSAIVHILILDPDLPE